jgi:hypothetical protein
MERLGWAVHSRLDRVLRGTRFALRGSIRVGYLLFATGGVGRSALIVLEDVRQFVDEQAVSRRRSRCELPLAEVDVRALRERLGAEVRCESCCGRAGVGAHMGEVVSEALVHPREHVIGQRCAGIVRLAYQRCVGRDRAGLGCPRTRLGGRWIERAREDRLRFEALYQGLLARAGAARIAVDCTSRGR